VSIGVKQISVFLMHIKKKILTCVHACVRVNREYSKKIESYLNFLSILGLRMICIFTTITNIWNEIFEVKVNIRKGGDTV
jgi:predicted outer membrane lipoprotein